MGLLIVGQTCNKTCSKTCNKRAVELAKFIHDHISRRPDSGIFMYVRRVPKEVRHLDKRGTIRRSLGTRDEGAAARLAAGHDAEFEAYWSALLAGAAPDGDAWKAFEAARDLARALKFSYLPADRLANAPTSQLLDRLKAVKDKNGDRAVTMAALGGHAHPRPHFSDLWSIYQERNSSKLAKLSPAQLKRHKRNKERSVEYAIEAIGDRALDEITRQDVNNFRRWWEDRTKEQGLTLDSANRSLSDLKGLLREADLSLQTDFAAPWVRSGFERDRRKVKRRRVPFPNPWIEEKLLASGALNGLNFEARMIVYITIETGLALNEACNLMPEHIVLSHDIPHVLVPERPDRVLKTVYRERAIPLVGVSLWAAQQAPDWFDRYRDKEGSASAIINKFLRSHGLMPTAKHSFYGLRHSFQDRILEANAPDRLQTDLMGHEFARPVYGEGAGLEQKQSLLKSIMLNWTAPIA